jgi:hypothetical protein
MAEAGPAMLRRDLDRIHEERLLADVVVAYREPQVAEPLA